LPLGLQYSLRSAALRVESPGADGNIPVKAEYQDLKVTNWSCRELTKKLEKGLRDFAASNVVYQVGPHGESASAIRSRSFHLHVGGGSADK